jgi:hypothetical protein
MLIVLRRIAISVFIYYKYTVIFTRVVAKLEDWEVVLGNTKELRTAAADC